MLNKKTPGAKKNKKPVSQRIAAWKTWKKVVLGFGGTMCILFMVLAVYAVATLSKLDIDKLDQDPEELGISNANEHSDDIVNIALFGIDTTSSNFIGRSDAIVILTIDKKHKDVKLSSVMRDAYVEIEGHGTDKINHAYAFGGAQLAVKTLNQNFGLDIKEYVSINFSNIEKLVDALGGITMNVTSNDRAEANKHISKLASQRGISADLIDSTGDVELSGMQALGMLRIRKGNTGGDYGRTDRHREFLTAVYDKLKTKNVLEYPAIINELLPLVKTSLTYDKILSLGTEAASKIDTIEQVRFPTDNALKNGYGGKMISGVWYLTFDKDICVSEMKNFIYNDVKPVVE